jgi:hypothetical protein
MILTHIAIRALPDLCGGIVVRSSQNLSPAVGGVFLSAAVPTSIPARRKPQPLYPAADGDGADSVMARSGSRHRPR